MYIILHQIRIDVAQTCTYLEVAGAPLINSLSEGPVGCDCTLYFYEDEAAYIARENPQYVQIMHISCPGITDLAQNCLAGVQSTYPGATR